MGAPCQARGSCWSRRSPGGCEWRCWRGRWRGCGVIGLLGGWMPAPSTLGTFLRAFTFGHVRQLDALLGETLVRAWRAGAGPREGWLVIDVDSFVGEVCGRLKQGAAYGYTKVLGYHPILATTRADTREVLHIRLRKGSANTSKGMPRFTDEFIARVTRAGANGVKLLRADSGFWNTKVFKRLETAGWQYSIGVRMQKGIGEAVQAIQQSDWQTIEGLPRGGRGADRRDHLRRQAADRPSYSPGRPQAELWPDWHHFAFLTNRTEDITVVEAEHRDHAVVEQVIVELKDQALAHFPSGDFNANGAWTVLGAIAHNLLRWTQLIGLPGSTIRAARTLRRWLITIAGRLTRHGRSWTLHLPARWPWHGDYLAAAGADPRAPRRLTALNTLTDNEQAARRHRRAHPRHDPAQTVPGNRSRPRRSSRTTTRTRA